MKVDFFEEGFCVYDPKNPSKVRKLKLFTKKVARKYYWYAYRHLNEGLDFEKTDSILHFINYLLDEEAKEKKTKNN